MVVQSPHPVLCLSRLSQTILDASVSLPGQPLILLWSAACRIDELPCGIATDSDQGAEALDRVQGVEVEPLVLQRPPEGFNHRVREGDVDLGEHALEAGAEQRLAHGAVDVLDTRVGVEQWSSGRDEMLASGE